MKALLQYWPIIGVLLQLVVLWICWSLRQLAHREVKREVEAAETRMDACFTDLDGRVDGHHDRIGQAEHSIREIRDDISGLPTKADLEKLGGEIRSVGVEVTAANSGIKRIEGFFLAKGVERA